MILVMLNFKIQRRLWRGRSFSDKIPKASDGAVGQSKYINQTQFKFKQMM